jgi:hypothetical protein
LLCARTKITEELLNVPITKPLLIVVLNGYKELGKDNEITCLSNHFIFLSNSPAINMRNIPKDNAYFALSNLIMRTLRGSYNILVLKKKKLLILSYYLGHQNLVSMIGNPKVSHQVHELCQESEFDKLTNEYICQQLAISESTLR